jgi:hypothetical protein
MDIPSKLLDRLDSAGMHGTPALAAVIELQRIESRIENERSSSNRFNRSGQIRYNPPA